jgi:hypothetical protein
VRAPELVAGLLAELARADTWALAKLFGSLPSTPAEPPPAVALATAETPAAEQPAEPGPTWGPRPLSCTPRRRNGTSPVIASRRCIEAYFRARNGIAPGRTDRGDGCFDRHRPSVG